MSQYLDQQALKNLNKQNVQTKISNNECKLDLDEYFHKMNDLDQTCDEELDTNRKLKKRPDVTNNKQ